MFLQIDEAHSNFLAGYGATPAEIAELLTSIQNIFSYPNLAKLPPFSLASEPHVASWERYYSQAQNVGAFKAVRLALVQLQFPIKKGISQTDNYRAATRKGYLTEGMAEATGLELEKPKELQLIIHQTLAGTISVIIAECRAGFVSLVQALTKRNELEPIPESMEATIVAGFNNWERIRYYRQEWEVKQMPPAPNADWQAEFQDINPQKHLYQDCFIILSRGNYSAILAAEIGIDEEEWLRLSLIIRLEPECCHYFTRRVFGSMRNNMIDELIADYQGIVAANGGRYRADWLLRFIGLESFPDYREGRRLQNYRGQPPLSDGAFKILQILVKDAAENLEKFNIPHHIELNNSENQQKFLANLMTINLLKWAVDLNFKLKKYRPP
jgi:hypothetical protein